MEKNYPIVIIPGVFDSKLFYDEKLTELAWPVKSVSKVLDLTHVDGLVHLEKEYAGATFYVKDPVDNTTAEEKEFGPNDVWKQLTEVLMEAFPDRQVWFFSYDFRQLSTTTMVKLKSFLESFDTPVDVVCHSYGNNLLASYLGHYGQDKIHRAACLCPPFEGSAEIFLVPAGSMYMPCMGELAPSPELNKVCPTYLIEKKGEEPVVVDEVTYNEILVKFFGSGYHPCDFSAILSLPEVHFAVGMDRLTPVSTFFAYDEKGNSYVSDFDMSFGGDGTVALESSSMFGKLTDKMTMFPGIAHSEFAHTPSVWYWVLMQLNSNQPPMRIPKVTPEPYLKMRIEGSTNVHVRKPFSVTDLISPSNPSAKGADSLVIGEHREVDLLSVQDEECLIEIYSITKTREIKIEVFFYDQNGKLINKREDKVSARFIRYTLDKDGNLSEPFVLDLPPLVGNDEKKGIGSGLMQAVSSMFNEAEKLLDFDKGDASDSGDSKEGDSKK